MAILNLKKILPNDSQIVVTDKINFNFDEILLAGGGPPGDPGLKGDQGFPGQQGIIGITGDAGEDGNEWYVDFGTPPVQTSPPTYFEDDYYLDTSTNNIWQFDGTFWVDTGLQLKVATGEFKEETFNSPATASILQDASKNLVISSRDYNGLAENPNSPAHNSKFKIINAPGAFIEMGLDLGVSGEDESEHVIFELDGVKNLNITNNGAGISIVANGDTVISNSTTITLNSLVVVGQTDGQYTGTIVNASDLVNKDYVDSSVSGVTLTGDPYDVIRIAGSGGAPENSGLLRIYPSEVRIDEDEDLDTEDTKLIVTGDIQMESMSGGEWDKADPGDGRYQIKGKQLESWGTFVQLATNTNDITFTHNFPVNYGANNVPIINFNWYPVVSPNPSVPTEEVWAIKSLTITASQFVLVLHYVAGDAGQKAGNPSFVDGAFSTTYQLRVQWHAVGGTEDAGVLPEPGGGQDSQLTP